MLALIGVSSILAVQNYQGIYDWWVLRSYEPTPVVSKLAADAFLSDRGTDLFYVSDPQLDEKELFNENCAFPERSLVLGCYNGSKIFILDVEPGKTEIVEPVTAAHEMLHAAYLRLSGSEKTNLNQLLDKQYSQVTNERIVSLVDEYREQDPDSLHNELHSILGTEYRDLGSELEAYYSTYFSDRLQLIEVAESYEAIFLDIEDQIATFRAQLDSLQARISDNEVVLDGIGRQITSERAQLDALFADEDFQQYNDRVPGFNGLVSRYNVIVVDTKAIEAEHNALVVEHNKIVIEQADLVQSLDSNFIEL